jgi:hypothetical protein
MTYKQSVIFFVFITIFPIHAQKMSDAVSQVLIPHEIFIGDVVELHYSFISPTVFPLGKNSSLQLELSGSPLESLAGICTVKQAVLSGKGNQYTLLLTLVPWKTGTIDFPVFDLFTLLDRKKSGFPIALKPFSVSSLVQKTGSETFRPPAPPVLIPGTTYAVYAVVMLVLVFLVLLIRVMLNLKGIINFYEKIIRHIGYNRNARLALRKLRKLQRTSACLDDRMFCDSLQAVTRSYLEYRFAYPFSAVTSDRFVVTFDMLMSGLLSPDQSRYVEILGRIFCRTDYIRYAGNSLDAARQPAQMYATVLSDKERNSLLSAVMGAVHFFEGGKPETGNTEEEKNNA